MPNGEGGPLAGRDHQVLFAVKQEGEGKGTFKFCEGLVHSLCRRRAFRNKMLRQQGDRFSVGIGCEFNALRGHFGAQLTEVFDDTVVHDCNVASHVGMRVVLVWRAVGGPAGVPDA